MEGPLVWLLLKRAKGIGPIRLSELMKACPDPYDAWQLSDADLAKIDHWGRASIEAYRAVKRDPVARMEATAEWEKAAASGLRLVCLTDPEYPYRLAHIPDPPPYYYQYGPWVPDSRPVVAIVGTRKPTAYGLGVARRFARELAEGGAVIVSGMARGIDCAAHDGALSVGGSTVAVLGSGADICYPREARQLYSRIRETGAILSEQPPGTVPRSEHFPGRNRIISGLADGVLVVEAGERSGTLITVGTGLQQGRDIFAVPGPVTSPMSVGPHRLIREGACLVTTASDILEELGFGKRRQGGLSRLLGGMTPEEGRVYHWLGEAPRWAGDLAEACGVSAGEVQSILTMLEIKGIARQLPSGQYVRIG